MKKFEDQIEDYILGLLSENEKITFESELLVNKDLQKSVNEHKLLLYNLDKLRIKNKVDRIIKADDSSNNLTLFFRIAAMLILLFGIFLLLKPSKLTESGVAKENQLPSDTTTIVRHENLPQEEIKNIDPSPVVNSDPKAKIDPLKLIKLASRFIALTEFSGLRSDDDLETNDIFEKIKRELAANHYSEALQHLNTIDSSQMNEYVMILKADCFFKLKNYKASSDIYSNLSSSFQYKYDAEWNLMLCNLLMNQKEKFDSTIKSILKDKDHPYYDKAIGLNKESKELLMQ